MNPPLDTHQPRQDAPRIGYVLKVYPCFSKTFIVTETLTREAQSEDLSIYALRPTTDARFCPEIVRIVAHVNQVGRPDRAVDLWSQLTEGLVRQEDCEHFAAIIPVLVELPGDVVTQGVELVHQARRDSITRLHAHFASLAGWVAQIASALTDIPYTVATHAEDIFHESVDLVWLYRICSDAQRVTAISRYNEGYLGTVLASTGATISLHYNALELDRSSYHAPQPVSATGAESLWVYTVGRLALREGFADPVGAVKILVSSRIDVEVELAGDGDEREHLAGQIERLELADRIHLLGPLMQVGMRELLACLDVFAAPCIETADGNIDGLPTVALRATACRTLVVVTAVSGLLEVIHGGAIGILLPPGDPTSLTMTLHGIAQDKVDIVALSHGARALTEEQFGSRAQATVLAAWQSSPVSAPGMCLADQEGTT